ncbi:MAG: transglutaminase family protein [Desulfatibacillaceae bacterium]|nr:transglutaminase family protein [Desulfatibacillaceae bacterium]
MEDLEKYLLPTEIIKSDSKVLIDFAEQAAGNASAPAQIASRLFLAVRDKIIYDPYSPFYYNSFYTPDFVLQRGRGYCVQKAALLCAACRAKNIPARLKFADLKNRSASDEMKEMLGCDIFAWHGFTQIYLNGQWLSATPSFHADLCLRQNISPLEFDGTANAVFPEKDLSGKPYASYLTYHGSFWDLPLEQIMEGWKKTYGSQRVELWRKALEAQFPAIGPNEDGLTDTQKG